MKLYLCRGARYLDFCCGTSGIKCKESTRHPSIFCLEKLLVLALGPMGATRSRCAPCAHQDTLTDVVYAAWIRQPTCANTMIKNHED